MTAEQTAHLNRILEQSRELITDKYARGTVEHKSLLSKDYTPEQVLDFAIEEAVDQMTYLLTLREMMRNEQRRP